MTIFFVTVLTGFGVRGNYLGERPFQKTLSTRTHDRANLLDNRILKKYLHSPPLFRGHVNRFSKRIDDRQKCDCASGHRNRINTTKPMMCLSISIFDQILLLKHEPSFRQIRLQQCTLHGSVVGMFLLNACSKRRKLAEISPSKVF